MATQVVRSSGALPAAVVCDDAEVAEWAAREGAIVIWTPRLGLNRAVQQGVAELASMGAARVVVAAGDLPLATELEWAARFPGVTLVPDRRHDGTNVIAVPSGSGFRFAYGPGSYARHLEEASRLELSVRIVHMSPLAWDVDLPEDLVTVDP
jgi:2-phospho-L-lactate guanylyltransferase